MIPRRSQLSGSFIEEEKKKGMTEHFSVLVEKRRSTDIEALKLFKGSVSRESTSKYLTAREESPLPAADQSQMKALYFPGSRHESAAKRRERLESTSFHSTHPSPA